MKEPTMEMFYRNKPCTIIAEFDDEVVIEIETSRAYFYDSGGQDSFEDEVLQRIIVDKKHITEKAISFDDAIADIEILKRKATNEIKKMKGDARSELFAEKETLVADIENLKKEASKLKGLREMVEFLTDQIKYVVYEDETGYNLKIEAINDSFCGNDEKELVAVSFRSKIRAKALKRDTQMYFSYYSDDSGNGKKRVKGFKDLPSAKVYFIKVLNSEKIKPSERIVKQCKVWGIKNDKCDEMKKALKKKADESREKEINRTKEKLIELQGKGK